MRLSVAPSFALVLLTASAAACSHAAGGTDPSTGDTPVAALDSKTAASLSAGAPDAGCDEECSTGTDVPAAPIARDHIPTRDAASRGPADAKITVVEFSDFECPYCAKAETTLRALEAAHPGEVRFVVKNAPLPVHTHARDMARAALAAGNQGHYWEMHDRLYKSGTATDRSSLVHLAGELGLDAARFARDLDDPTLDARIDADRADAEALDVKGLPTFFVNGRRIVGAQPLATFEAAATANGT